MRHMYLYAHHHKKMNVLQERKKSTTKTKTTHVKGSKTHSPYTQPKRTDSPHSLLYTRWNLGKQCWPRTPRASAYGHVSVPRQHDLTTTRGPIYLALHLSDQSCLPNPFLAFWSLHIFFNNLKNMLRITLPQARWGGLQPTKAVPRALVLEVHMCMDIKKKNI